jgi:hypothetical protein
MPPDRPRQDSRTRAEEALSLRACGHTWAAISTRLGYRSRGAAQWAVHRLLDKTPPETPGQARAKADESLRITQSILFTRLAVAVKADNDDLVTRMAREIRSTVSERAKLVGAYAPSQVDVTVHETTAAILERAMRELEALPATTVSSRPVLEAEVISS